MTLAVYPGSFDPITNGHVDVARRAAAIFERVVVAVYDTPPKNVLFATAERVEMARHALAGISNVTVDSFSKLTVDYTRGVGGKVIVRGLRAISDFELELQMALLNRQLAPDIEVICLMASQQHSFLSSSIVKEIAKLGGAIEDLVPATVASALRDRYAREQEPPPVPRHLST
ncbi:MAG: pantetheine-phosphate adenylyltransferase [Chloroflexota bacterium]